MLELISLVCRWVGLGTSTQPDNLWMKPIAPMVSITLTTQSDRGRCNCVPVHVTDPPILKLSKSKPFHVVISVQLLLANLWSKISSVIGVTPVSGPKAVCLCLGKTCTWMEIGRLWWTLTLLHAVLWRLTEMWLFRTKLIETSLASTFGLRWGR